MTTPPSPSRAAKLLAVAAFFLILYLMARLIGLPVNVDVVAAFFLLVIAPSALFVAVLAAVVVHLLVRRASRLAQGESEEAALPLLATPQSVRPFDLGLQIFVVASLLGTGLFLVSFPRWLTETYPEVRSTIEKALSTDQTREEKQVFLERFDVLWGRYTDFLLGRPGAPSEHELRDVASELYDAMLPVCDTCRPELTREETQRLAEIMGRL